MHENSLNLFFSAAGIPGSDGDHNKPKIAEFNCPRHDS
ncbi:hypothetical protein FORC065_2042 [Yersinia enterocolitica]|nr:hypothetical protein FORC065_2042 [Yersinia enterocolitica]